MDHSQTKYVRRPVRTLTAVLSTRPFAGACLSLCLLVVTGCGQDEDAKIEHPHSPHKPIDFVAAVAHIEELHQEIIEGPLVSREVTVHREPHSHSHSHGSESEHDHDHDHEHAHDDHHDDDHHGDDHDHADDHDHHVDDHDGEHGDHHGDDHDHDDHGDDEHDHGHDDHGHDDHAHDDHDHDHGHGHGHGHHHHHHHETPEMDAIEELADVIRWLPEIAADGELKEEPWNQVYEASGHMTDLLDKIEALDGDARREAYLAQREAIEKQIAIFVEVSQIPPPTIGFVPEANHSD